MSYRFIERSYLDREKPRGFARDVLALTSNLCADIPWRWIARARDAADVIIYPKEHINGIAFIKFKKDYGYVDLICAARGHGSDLLEIAEKLAMERGKTRMILCSISTPFGFYLKKGYKVIDRNCEWYDTVRDKYDVVQKMPDGKFVDRKVIGCGLPDDACVYMEKVFNPLVLPIDIKIEEKTRRAGPIRIQSRMERFDPKSPLQTPRRSPLQTPRRSPLQTPRRSPRLLGRVPTLFQF